MEKIHALYLKSSKSLYAFTTEKDIALKFLSERNPKCFVHKRLRMEEIEQKLFISNHKEFLLMENAILEDVDGKIVRLAMTYKEDNEIQAYIEYIFKQIEDVEKILRDYPLSDKYDKHVRRLMILDDGEGSLKIDTLSLFMSLFKPTFLSDYSEDRDPLAHYDLPFQDPQSFKKFIV